MKNFRSYQLAKNLYLEIKTLNLKGEERDQLHRSSLSICLNLVEGSAKSSKKDQLRFFEIAFASLRESQALLELIQNKPLQIKADILAAHIYKLLRA